MVKRINQPVATPSAPQDPLKRPNAGWNCLKRERKHRLQVAEEEREGKKKQETPEWGEGASGVWSTRPPSLVGSDCL